MSNPYRSLPSIDRLLGDPRLQSVNGLPRSLLADLAREILSQVRGSLSEGGDLPETSDLVRRVLCAADSLTTGSFRRVLNGTGVIIHTNLGRAPLSDEARAEMESASRGYSNLEFDLESGERGTRYVHLQELLQRVTGAEDGIAVNNNASALLLTLSALASGKEVVISRSQAVEIGGGFRIPDVMRQSGARLVEVGTTNRTYTLDFADALGPETAALLRVHSSNFRIIGFTTFPELSELAALAHERNSLLLDDLGSGCLLPVEPFGLSHEPLVQESLAAGADLALFSGDKLLGGPQAGIIVGRKELIARLRRHPLARAVRMDKGSIAGLAATLRHYLRGEALEKVPVWRMIATPLQTLEERALRIVSQLDGCAQTQTGRSVVGGGSLPEETLPTVLIALRAPSATALATRLRQGDPALVSRVESDMVIIDPRTIDSADDLELVQAVRRGLSTGTR